METGRMILLDEKEVIDAVYGTMGEMGLSEIVRQGITRDSIIIKAQAEKILIQLQAIYKLPDLKMEHDRMGEFIQELMEEINGNV